MAERRTDPPKKLRARLTSVRVSIGAAVVLNGADFEVRAGETAYVWGSTASGKSTFVHLLRLALKPDEGFAMVLGVDGVRDANRAREAAKRRIGYIAQEPVLIERSSAFENAAMPLRIAGRRQAQYEDDVLELLGFVGIRPAAEVPAYRLSAVERRWLSVARALANKPDLILADCPTAGLPPEAARRMLRLLGEMSRMGAAVVITGQEEALMDGAPAAHWRLQSGRLTLLDRAEEGATESTAP